MYSDGVQSVIVLGTGRKSKHHQTNHNGECFSCASRYHGADQVK